MVEEFQRIGKDLVHMGLVSSHGGNMSVRRGDSIWATARGAMLGHLTEKDIVQISLENRLWDEAATSDILVHREIYQRTRAKAVIHAHPIHAIALSFKMKEIVPTDVEGAHILKKIPVVGEEFRLGSAKIASQIAEALSQVPAVVFKGHGSFTIGVSLAEALHLISTLEASAKILVLANIMENVGGKG